MKSIPFYPKTLFSGFIALFLLLLGFSLADSASQTAITVDTTADIIDTSGDCSLREAIIAANSDTAVDGCPAGNGADMISLPAGTYTFAIAGEDENDSMTGDLDLLSEMNIVGADAQLTVINAAGLDRVFHLHEASVVEISGLTISGGDSMTTFAGGGGILNEGLLTLTDVIITDNDGRLSGGGFTNTFRGNVTLDSVQIIGNRSLGSDLFSTHFGGFGGGFVNYGIAVVDQSQIVGNETDGSGGGIYNGGEGQLTVTNSEVSQNTAGTDGGGIIQSINFEIPPGPPPSSVVNTTISGNEAGLRGGGIALFGRGDLDLFSVTITDNTADSNEDDSGDGGGVHHTPFNDVELSAVNSIIAGNFDNSPTADNFPDCSGNLASKGYNLIENVMGCTIEGEITGNLTGVSPILGPLQDNGGPTNSHSLLEGSPAVDGGNPAGCVDHNAQLLIIDQRGFARPAAGSSVCDMGAVESGANDPSEETATPTVTETATTTPIATTPVGEETPTATPISSPTATPTITSTPDPENPAEVLDEVVYLPLIVKADVSND
ncbi:MAG: choice-of-anchor Q domain-containing protein [Anaerolineae bacterium]